MEYPDDKAILVLYHGGCPDGFGSAYAAWKKFGDAATYIPLSRDEEDMQKLLERVKGKDIFFLDFCADSQERMNAFVENAKSLVILDHHVSVKEIVESMPEYRYGTDESGAGLSWKYFHPGTPLPKLLAHIQDSDLFFFNLPNTRAVITYLEMIPFEFPAWDELMQTMENEETFEPLLVKMKAYAEYFDLLVQYGISKAKLVSFEGYECYYGVTLPLQSLRAQTGNLLVKKKGPIALMVSGYPKGYAVTIYGDGVVDVSKIAQKFGGGGHKSASGFFIPREGPFPWTQIDIDETLIN